MIGAAALAEPARGGVDTWGMAWRVDPTSSAGRYLDAEAVVPSGHGGRMLPQKVGGHRLGWMPEHMMLWAEGHPGEGYDAPTRELPGALAALRERMAGLGLEVDAGRGRRQYEVHPWMKGNPARGELMHGADWSLGRAPDAPPVTLAGQRWGWLGMRRLDPVVNLRFGRASHGAAFIAGCGALLKDLGAGGKTEIWWGANSIETVAMRGRSGKRIVARIYDKGVESGGAPRGTWLRLEQQRRWSSGDRPNLSALTTEAVAADFRRRFARVHEASGGVRVVGTAPLADALNDLVEAGELTAAAADSLAGFVMRRARTGRGTTGHERTTEWRRERRLRELGLVYGDGVVDEVELDLGELLELALDAGTFDPAEEDGPALD